MTRGRELVATLRPGQNLEHLLTDEDRRLMHAAMDAAAVGDPVASLELHMAGLVVEESIYPDCLRDLIRRGAAAPGWMYSRWCVDQAYRWMLLHEDPRTDETVRLVLAATHADHLDAVVDDPLRFMEYGTLVAGCDWIAQQLCVYEHGGLADFIDLRAGAGLLDRADRVREWSGAAMGAYRARQTDGHLILRDLSDGSHLEVADEGDLHGRREGGLIGRVVPSDVGAGAMFESRPLAVDAQTTEHAGALLADDADLGWLIALSDARHHGRLERGFSCHQRALWSGERRP